MAIRKSSISGGSGSNGFSLLVGSSGNTTFTFDTDQPAGAYSVSSELSDTTFDIYLVTSSNANAGYTNSTALEATADFNRVVLYGGTENDILTFDYKASASPATKGDVADGAAPFLTSATPTTLASVDDTTTVTGGNFAADVGISFTGQDAIVVPAKSVVRSSSTELIVTRPDAFLVAQEPFSMTATNAGITNPSVVVNKLTDYFDAGSGLVWVTTSPLAGFLTDSAYSETLEATDVDGGAITYAVTTGSVPTGLSLNSATGVISGTPTGTSDETFTVTATDAGGNSSPREFLLPNLSLEVDYLVIAGGGGGGGTALGGNQRAGGGGAGGYRTSAGTSGGGASAESSLSLTVSTNYTVTVGAGGNGTSSSTNASGSNGSNTVLSAVTSTGGGGGGGLNPSGGAGGSGGGAGADPASSLGSGTASQGFAGGSSGGYNTYGGGGGGGAEAGNTDGSAAGGDGVASSITGSSVTRAGGGGGGNSGGGGDGGGGSSLGGSGTVETGGGGGAGWAGTAAGNGGSGVVILKYPDAFTATFSGGVTSSTATAGGYKITTITATSTTSETVSFAA